MFKMRRSRDWIVRRNKSETEKKLMKGVMK